VRLIVAENDNFLPVVEESASLLKRIPGLQRTVIPFGGHTILQDPRFVLADFVQTTGPGADVQAPKSGAPRVAASDSDAVHGDALHAVGSVNGATLRGAKQMEQLSVSLRSRFAEKAERHSAHTPDDIPARERLDEVRDKFARSRRIYAPVYVGSERIPVRDSSKPVLFVCNHTLTGAIDAALIIEHLVDHRGVLPRSLTHPAVIDLFDMLERQGNRPISLGGVGNIKGSDVASVGLVRLSPRALVRELANNRWVLLFPGGAREAHKRKGDERYSLHWPASAEFVRAAASFGADIVPISLVGSEDAKRIVLDSMDLKRILNGFESITGQKTPFSQIPRYARDWKKEPSEEEMASMIPPLLASAPADRIYVRFGDPISVPYSARSDRKLAQTVYKRVQRRVQIGIEILKRRRRRDIYRSPAARAAFRSRHGNAVNVPATPAWTWETQAGAIDEES
jgi:1-acyl-sn-glycerol-3-phosphate acyltransferase